SLVVFQPTAPSDLEIQVGTFALALKPTAIPFVHTGHTACCDTKPARTPAAMSRSVMAFSLTNTVASGGARLTASKATRTRAASAMVRASPDFIVASGPPVPPGTRHAVAGRGHLSSVERGPTRPSLVVIQPSKTKTPQQARIGVKLVRAERHTS